MGARFPSVGEGALGARPKASVQRGIATYQPVVAASVGEGLGSFGRELRHAAGQALLSVEEINKEELAKAHSAFTTAKIETELGLAEDRDHKTLETRYLSTLEKAKKQAGKSISNPRLRQQFDQNLREEILKGQAKIRTRAFGLNADESLASLDELLANNRQTALTTNDDGDRQRLIEASNMAIQGARDRGFLTSEQATNMRQSWGQSYAEAFVETQNPEDRLRLLDHGKGIVSIIPAERAQALRAAAEKQIETETRERNAYAVSDLEIAVNRGEAGVREIEAAYQAGTLTPAKRTELTKVADKVTNASVTEDAQIGRVVSSMAAGLPLDPGNTDDRRAVDLHFSRVFAPALAQTAPERQVEAVLGYVNSAGVVPTALKNQWTATLRGNDAATKAGTADAIARLNEMNPRLLENFDATDRRVAMSIASNLRLGIPAPQAVKRAEEAVHNADDPARKVRAARLSEEKLLKNSETVVADALAEPALFSLDFGDATVGDAIVGEYRTLYRDHYLATGDADASKDLALSDVKRTWAVSRVGGERRLMKYAPERYGVPTMSDADNAAWMQGQLNADLQGLGLPSEGIRLEVDPVTARQSPPSYIVLHEREDGVIDTLIKNGSPLRWRPDWKTAPKRKEIEAEIEAGVSKAKARRLQLIQQGPDPMAGLPVSP